MDRSRSARLRRVLVAAVVAVVGTFVLIPGSAAAAGTGAITGYGGKCVDVAGANTANGTKVQLWTCNGTGAQRFTLSGAGDLVNIQANKCVDVQNVATANGSKLHIWTCNGASNQKWRR